MRFNSQVDIVIFSQLSILSYILVIGSRVNWLKYPIQTWSYDNDPKGLYTNKSYDYDNLYTLYINGPVYLGHENMGKLKWLIEVIGLINLLLPNW